jgi:hypothetical protein
MREWWPLLSVAGSVVAIAGVWFTGWVIRTLTELRDSARDVKAVLEGVGGGEGLVAWMKTVRVRTHHLAGLLQTHELRLEEHEEAIHELKDKGKR